MQVHVEFFLCDSSSHETSGLDELAAMVDAGQLRGIVDQTFPLEVGNSI